MILKTILNFFQCLSTDIYQKVDYIFKTTRIFEMILKPYSTFIQELIHLIDLTQLKREKFHRKDWEWNFGQYNYGKLFKNFKNSKIHIDTEMALYEMWKLISRKKIISSGKTQWLFWLTLRSLENLKKLRFSQLNTSFLGKCSSNKHYVENLELNLH